MTQESFDRLTRIMTRIMLVMLVGYIPIIFASWVMTDNGMAGAGMLYTYMVAFGSLSIAIVLLHLFRADNPSSETKDPSYSDEEYHNAYDYKHTEDRYRGMDPSGKGSTKPW